MMNFYFDYDVWVVEMVGVPTGALKYSYLESIAFQWAPLWARGPLLLDFLISLWIQQLCPTTPS